MQTNLFRLLWFSLLGCVTLCASTAMAESHAAPPMMLAESYAGQDVANYWISEKLDGVRGRWDGSRLYTRTGHPIATPAWFTAGWPRVPMDGELWSGRGRFDELSALVRTGDRSARAWTAVRFMVFDLPGHRGPFGQRVEHIVILTRHAGVAWLQPVAQYRLATREELDRRLRQVVRDGGEGLMLHHRDAIYRSGRSALLLKLKAHDDAEARVVGYTAGKGKYAGLVGALMVELPDGRRFRLGSGLSDTDRAQPPPIGTPVTYRYDGFTSNGLPRFARFMRVRHEPAPPDP